MLRRLLEASTRAGGPAASSSPPATATAALPTSPDSLLGSSGPSSGSLASPGPPVPTPPPPHNATLYLPDTEDLEYSILAAFSDMETVFLACISTLLPLIVALGIAFGVRHVWRKYRERRSSGASGLPWYRGVCSRDDTSESLHHRPHSASQTIQPPTQILSAQDLVNGLDGPRYICETEVMEEVALAPGNGNYVSPGSHTNKNANGNIITLTLKNNHLIVETEERAVTMEEPRVRKYQDNGCSVIVEVPPGYQSDETDVNRGSSDDMAARVTDQQALVHREEIPEDRSSSAFDNAKLFGSTNTGLSQSDLSICSQGSVNPSYRYGNQFEYEAGQFGYAMYGCEPATPAALDSSRKLEANSKWVEFDKSPDTEKTLLEDSKSPSLEKDVGDNVCGTEKLDEENHGTLDVVDASDEQPRLNGATKPGEQPLLDLGVDASKPVITGVVFKDEASLQEDTFQEQQRKLGNGTLTPEHLRLNDNAAKAKVQQEANNKEHSNGLVRPEGSSFVPCHKRTGSIPPRLIEESLEIERKKGLDIYSQIKTSTKSILPGLSPKFELLQNEVSPVDEKES